MCLNCPVHAYVFIRCEKWNQNDGICTSTLIVYWPCVSSVLRDQSYELTRGPPELVQLFRLQGDRPESAACPKFDMVWQYCSPILVGSREGNFLVQMIFTCRLYV